jgi:hypothetical protein
MVIEDQQAIAELVIDVLEDVGADGTRHRWHWHTPGRRNRSNHLRCAHILEFVARCYIIAWPASRDSNMHHARRA